jgi:hypothetical protein
MLCDPNILACRDWKELLQQLIDSKARININQGLDIRLMTEEKAEMIGKLRVESVHFCLGQIPGQRNNSSEVPAVQGNNRVGSQKDKRVCFNEF